ncbi:MAG TPA: peptide deformylase [Planctomycetota bacterium]|nr:peptide deformylase [Planctomycetota bacterium]
MEILKYPHPCLKRKCKPVKRIDDELVMRVAEMFETMYNARGVGLAAPQVGWDARLFIINVSGEKRDETVFVNPVIVEMAGTVNEEEGCLSVPGVNAVVPRAERVRVRAFDMKGNGFELEADGLLAIVLQHENDHLDGKLFISKLTRAAKEAIAEKLKELEDEFEASPPTEAVSR